MGCTPCMSAREKQCPRWERRKRRTGLLLDPVATSTVNMLESKLTETSLQRQPSRSHVLIRQPPFTFAYSTTGWSKTISSPAGHCQRTYTLLQFLRCFSFCYCLPWLPECGNVFVPMASSLLVGKPLRPWETPAHPTHACYESSLYAVV